MIAITSTFREDPVDRSQFQQDIVLKHAIGGKEYNRADPSEVYLIKYVFSIANQAVVTKNTSKTIIKR